MDIIIETLSKEFLKKNIKDFIEILKDEPCEYWKEEHFIKELTGKFDISFIALNKNILVGYIIASIKQEGAYIHKFMISGQYRGRGIGSDLQYSFESKVKLLNLKKIFLTLFAENNNTLKFYEKNGFNKIGERTDSVTFRALIIMEKDLK
jgi:ribosomal protein S18 acetylase RimI-like enzyme